MKRIKKALKVLRAHYYILVFKLEKKHYEFPRVESIQKTLRLINLNKMSLIRYGDGEFNWMLGKTEVQHFQKSGPELTTELIHAFNSKHQKLMVAIPSQLSGSFSTNTISNGWWANWFRHEFVNLSKVVDFSGSYGDSMVTRFYELFGDSEAAAAIVRAWKDVWAERNVIIVEGEFTRFGVGNDLLANARSVQRVICPAENAFEKRQQIQKSVISVAKELKNPLILCSLGPTATILCAGWTLNQGIQAIDVGHADLQYEYFLRKNSTDLIPGKYINESKHGHDTSRLSHEDFDGADEYHSQIVNVIHGN